MTGLGLKAMTLVEMLAPTKSPRPSLPRTWRPPWTAQDKVRGLSRRLLPVELEEGLLAVALEQLVAAVNTGSGIACTFAVR